MDQTVFAVFLEQIHRCLQIVHCFAHSEDKAAIMELIEGRLCMDVDAASVTSLVKAATFSKDRLKMLRILSKHLKELNQDGAKTLVTSCFDSTRDKAQAWGILCQRFPFTNSTDIGQSTWTNCEVTIAGARAAPSIVQYIKNFAKTKAERISAFDLPLIDDLSLLRETIIDNRQSITDQVEQRHRDGHDFVEPSRISTITKRLNPDHIQANGPDTRIDSVSKSTGDQRRTGGITRITEGSPTLIHGDQAHQSLSQAHHDSGEFSERTRPPRIHRIKTGCATPLHACHGNSSLEMVH